MLILGLLVYGEALHVPMVVAFASVLVAVALYTIPLGRKRAT